MTRRFFLTTMMCAALVGMGVSGAKADGVGFIGGIEDLPLMPGLTEDTDATLVFETPEGRIIEADAFGPVAADHVRAFYNETLPQLGWEEQGPGRFVRDGESLRLDFSNATDITRVRFRLAPRG